MLCSPWRPAGISLHGWPLGPLAGLDAFARGLPYDTTCGLFDHVFVQANDGPLTPHHCWLICFLRIT